MCRPVASSDWVAFGIPDDHVGVGAHPQRSLARPQAEGPGRRFGAQAHPVGHGDPTRRARPPTPGPDASRCRAGRPGSPGSRPNPRADRRCRRGGRASRTGSDRWPRCAPSPTRGRATAPRGARRPAAAACTRSSRRRASARRLDVEVQVLGTGLGHDRHAPLLGRADGGQRRRRAHVHDVDGRLDLLGQLRRPGRGLALHLGRPGERRARRRPCGPAASAACWRSA